MFGSAESEMVRLISPEIHDISTSQTDGRTDRQLALAIPRYAYLRAVKIK